MLWLKFCAMVRSSVKLPMGGSSSGSQSGSCSTLASGGAFSWTETLSSRTVSVASGGFSEEIGIAYFLTVSLTIRFDAEIESTRFSSSRNSAPRMHCIPFSLFVTMKFVQKLAFSSFADVSWNFLWLVPTIMFDDVPAAVDIRIDVGVTGRDSFCVTLWWSRLFDAPVSTRQRTGSVDGGKVIVTKYSFLPTLVLYSVTFFADSLLFCLM